MSLIIFKTIRLGVIHKLRRPKFGSYFLLPPSGWHTLTLAILPPNVNVDICKSTPYKISNKVSIISNFGSNYSVFLAKNRWMHNHFLMMLILCQRWHFMNLLSPSSCQRKLWMPPKLKVLCVIFLETFPNWARNIKGL